MRRARFWNGVTAALFAGVLCFPAPAAAFWSGPGCFVANMMAGGMFSGGIGFSRGGRGAAYGLPHGALPPYRLPHPAGPGGAWMSPAPSYGAERPVPGRAAEILQANVWSSELREPPRAAGVAPGPRNRWQP